MKPAKASLLLHPVFLLSLFTLIVNDTYAKYAYANWFTGKLSDFAGIVVLPVFLRVLWPHLSILRVGIIVVTFFAWWKSDWSQPVITFCNTTMQLPISRVVDYWDLMSLLVLPLGLTIQPKSLRFRFPAMYAIRWLMGMITFLSLCSTSVYRPLFQVHPTSGEIYFHETISFESSADHLFQTLAAKGINYRRDSVVYYPVTNQHDLFYKQQHRNDSLPRWQQLSQVKDSLIYVKWEGEPYYLIPVYRIEKDNTIYHFQNIRFTLKENEKQTKTKVTIQMFAGGHVLYGGMMKNSEKNKYKRIFEEMFLSNP